MEPLIQPSIPGSGEEIYNLLMASIEPELTTNQIPLLDTKYKKEKAADRKKRMKRYNDAFAQYDRAFIEYSKQLGARARAYKHAVLEFAEEKIGTKEKAQLQDLENQLSTSA